MRREADRLVDDHGRRPREVGRRGDGGQGQQQRKAEQNGRQQARFPWYR